jgi:hypothetical protein
MRKPLPSEFQSSTKIPQRSDVDSNSSPLVIYVAEREHHNMTYSSLLKQLIEKCESEGLSVKAFSEIGTQEYRVNWLSGGGIDGNTTAIEEQLKLLGNVPLKEGVKSEEDHRQTTEFLDSVGPNGQRMVPMGNVKERWCNLVPKAWKELPDEIKTGTAADVFRYYREKGTIDNPLMLQILEDDLEKGEIAKGPYYRDKLGQQNQLVEQLEKLDGDDRVRVLRSINKTFETSGMSGTVEPLLKMLYDPAEKITSEDKKLLLTHIDTWCANNNCTGNINGFLQAVERNYVHPEQEISHFASQVSNLVQQLKDLRIDGDRDHNDRYQEMRSSIIKTLDPQNEKNIGSLLDDSSNPEAEAALVSHISEYSNPSVSSNPMDAFLNDVKDRWSFDTGSPPRYNLYPLKIKKDYPIEIERTLDFSRASGYHDLLGGVLNYRLVHQTMADDIRRELSGKTTPDVVIAITGNAHVFGLKQQLPEFANSKTIVVTGNEVDREKPLTDPTAKAVHDENNKLIEGGEIVGFDFDKNTNGAIIPPRLTEVINQKSQSKRSPESFAHVDISATIDALDLATNKLPSKTKKESSVTDHLDLAGTNKGDKGSWAQKILEKRAQEKESQNRNDGS